MGLLRSMKGLQIVPYIGTSDNDSDQLDMLVAAARTPSACPAPSSPTESQSELPNEVGGRGCGGGPFNAEPGSTSAGKEPGVGSFGQTKCAVKSCGVTIVKQPSRTVSQESSQESRSSKTDLRFEMYNE